MTLVAAINWAEIAFFAFAILSALSAVFVVGSRNVIHAALYLVLVLGGIAAVFLLLGAEFLGWTQVLIYVGAIVVLLLFGLMLTRAPIGREILDRGEQRWLAFICSGAVFAVLTWTIWDAFGSERISLEEPVRTADVGQAMFEGFILPFELISVLLLGALVGAIVLAKRD